MFSFRIDGYNNLFNWFRFIAIRVGSFKVDLVTKERRQTRATLPRKKKNINKYAHWDMERANDEGPRETAPAY